MASGGDAVHAARGRSNYCIRVRRDAMTAAPLADARATAEVAPLQGRDLGRDEVRGKKARLGSAVICGSVLNLCFTAFG